VNTGWTGGAYGTGKRMKLSYTRAMVNAALHGELDKVATKRDPVFGLEVPTAIEKVPAEILDPRGPWKDSAAYDAQAKKLAGMFAENIKKFGNIDAKIREAGPRVG